MSESSSQVEFKPSDIGRYDAEMNISNRTS